jgi:hypothetical protein
MGHQHYYSTNGTNFPTVAGGLLDLSPLNVWYHVAVDKDAAGKIRIYVNGVMKGSATPANSAFHNSTAVMRVGRDSNTARWFNGWIDEVRVTKGVARYASDGGFSVPTAAFPHS